MEVLGNIITLALAALIGFVLGIFLAPLRDRIELWWEARGCIWRGRIPKGYKGRDKLTRIRKGKKIKIFDEKYKVAGFIEYNFGGIRYFVPQIEPEKDPEKDLDASARIRWLGFEDENLYLWIRWTDDEFTNIMRVSKPSIPETLSLDHIRESLRTQLEPFITFGAKNARVKEIHHGKILILFGEYAPWKADCTRIIFRMDEPLIHICLIYYGGETCNPEKYAGIEITPDDILFV